MKTVKFITSLFLFCGLISPRISATDPIDAAVEYYTTSAVHISDHKVPGLFDQAKEITTNTQQIADTLHGVATTVSTSVNGLAPVADTVYNATAAFNQGSAKIYDTGMVVTDKLAKLPEKAAVCLMGCSVAVAGLGLIYKAITNSLSDTPAQANAPFWRRYPNLIQGTLGSLFCVAGFAMTLKSDAIVKKLS